MLYLYWLLLYLIIIMGLETLYQHMDRFDKRCKRRKINKNTHDNSSGNA